MAKKDNLFAFANLYALEHSTSATTPTYGLSIFENILKCSIRFQPSGLNFCFIAAKLKIGFTITSIFFVDMHHQLHSESRLE